MSKIQKALDRIQRNKISSQPGKSSQIDNGDSVVFAKIMAGGHSDGLEVKNRKCVHVDHDALRKAGLIAPEYHEHLLANQYRDIKRPLIAHAFGKNATKVDGGNVIMVTSALPGEGKTFTSINLALSMAQERDHEVVLVDADVAKPHTSAMFGATDEPGLLDLLENPQTEVDALVLPTDVKGLSILPAGRPRHHATELLASIVMKNVIRTLSSRSPGQIVIFDSPPLLLTSEAKVLSSLVGQVVVVVRAEESAQDAIEAALALLDEDQAVNLVLNQTRAGFGRYQNGYGYGYGYGVDQSDKETGVSK